MKTIAPPPVIQRRLVQARTAYNFLRLLQHGGTFLAALALLWFALLFSVERSWLTSRSVYQNLLVAGGLAAFFGALYLLRATLARRRDPAFLAAAIEGARPALQDRLNTLIFLDAKENTRARRHFSPAIAGQTAPVLGGRAANPLYPRAWVWAHLVTGLACVGGVVWFNHHYNPLRNLVSASAALAPVQPPPADAPFELQSKNTAEVAGKEAWGEVRIVEPGRDQKLTKLDVVPLRIEMAARDPLTAHEWVTSVNGEPEVVHPLDPAPEPCFAAYSVLFYLDELKVSDWDVVSYYARAQTSKGNAYGSQIYFIEIRPFRDDLLKGMPGGAGGKAYDMLSDLTQLTAEQSRILRDTHQHEQMAYERPELQQEDRRKLASTESDLAVATDHVYGKIASELEDVDIGPVLSHLNSAEGHMNRSAEALRSDVVSEGKNRQQQALMELVATRKALQKVVSEHPGGFGGNGGGDDEDIPIAERAKHTLQALQQVAEFRDQEKAAQAAMAKLAADEKQLSNLPYRAYQDRSKDLVKQQAEMNKRLDDLSQENPDLFAHSKAALDTARQGMQEAKTALADKENTYSTRTSLTHATDDLNDLNRSLGENNSRRDLERAYAMKKAIDQSARALHAAEAKPDALTPAQADALAAGARQSTRTLKEVSGQSFGPGLSDALSSAKQAELDSDLQRFQSGRGKGRAQAAADARANLDGVSKAFDASRPPMVQNMAKQDALGGRRGGSPGQGPGQGGGALDSLLEKLQSFALQDDNGHHLPPDARTKERAELLGEMEEEIPRELGKTDAAAALLAEAEKELTKKGNMPVDPEVLKHLQEKLETMQASASEKNAALAADGTSIADASRAPASYRQRLQRYYETLSRIKP